MIGIGGSAGAIPVLKDLLSWLPSSLPVPIVVVQHMNAEWPSQLPAILGYRTALKCKWAENGELAREGTVHVAPPGRNLVVGPKGVLKIIEGTKPPTGWPSVDLFMCSMAEQLGPQAIGIILSGMLHDGAKGISALRRAGGATMVQHPGTADSASMPQAAIDLGRADLLRSPVQIVEAISILVEHGVE
jgi:chemotaxis response regulator CheB